MRELQARQRVVRPWSFIQACRHGGEIEARTRTLPRVRVSRACSPADRAVRCSEFERFFQTPVPYNVCLPLRCGLRIDAWTMAQKLDSSCEYIVNGPPVAVRTSVAPRSRSHTPPCATLSAPPALTSP